MRRPLRVITLLILLGSLISFDIPAKAQGLPALQQGELYIKERQKLLAQGWQKVIDFTKDCKLKHIYSGFARDTCFKYQEHDDCSANGYCAFIWKDNRGNILKVVTFGDEYGLVNWSVE